MTDKQPKSPPKVKMPGQGRPGVDWHKLYTEWMKSAKTKRDFLKEYGFSTTSSHIKKIIKAWSKDEIATRKAMGELIKSHRTEEQHTAELWQVVQQWRRMQASEDWKTADAIRNHAKLILNNSLTKDIDGSVQTKLLPRELVALADAMEKVQRMQRLALGMSTENVGMDAPEPQSHVAQGETTLEDEDGCPVFVVEVNQNGKFVRPKPRRVK